MTINFSLSAGDSLPFPFFVSLEFLAPDVAEALLTWCENEAPWELAEEDFYEQYELDFMDADVPAPLEALRTAETLDALRAGVSSLLSCALTGPVEMTLHRLIPGQRIRVHNDYLVPGPSARLVIQLNRGWQMGDGGMLLLFSAPPSGNPTQLLAPVHRAALGFQISSTSFHAVSLVHSGCRYSLVISLYG